MKKQTRRGFEIFQMCILQYLFQNCTTFRAVAVSAFLTSALNGKRNRAVSWVFVLYLSSTVLHRNLLLSLVVSYNRQQIKANQLRCQSPLPWDFALSLYKQKCELHICSCQFYLLQHDCVWTDLSTCTQDGEVERSRSVSSHPRTECVFAHCQ